MLISIGVSKEVLDRIAILLSVSHRCERDFKIKKYCYCKGFLKSCLEWQIIVCLFLFIYCANDLLLISLFSLCTRNVNIIS